jgi:hypothetical protein
MVTRGYCRVSRRELDPLESTEWHPVQKGAREQRLKAGEAVDGDRKPRALSENPASLAGLPIHPPIAGRSAEMTSGRDDLIDRHIRSYLKEVTVRAIRTAGTVTLPSDLNCWNTKGIPQEFLFRTS